ncbi:hypothetical protein HG536_0D02680 [Torulaspora globosa]|uniref:Arf-GAP domain-containing protein n=1 Tax=Torulaspora globosa TaxID=48254 RepID=A0A7G3ZGW0_9SACH|nr:uncharacterized protein HG536_0D02680 [Torulaspora globosa]QLL32746.1 hypothetical protein HG536_0D02680 [Torulaspora globosa]
MRFRSSSYASKSSEKELKDLVNLPENGNRCGECGNVFPTWCSVNLGVFLCGRCASVHRKILSLRDDDAYSDVKSLTIDRWSERDLDDLARSGGNRHNNELWNPKKQPFPYDGDEDKSVVEQFIRDKYVNGKFRYSAINPDDYGISGNRRRRDSTRERSRSGSSLNVRRGYGSAGDLPRLSNRQARDYELSRYSRELRTLKDMGFRDIDLNAQALSHAHGDVNRAIDILENHNRGNGSSTTSLHGSRGSSVTNSRAGSRTNLSAPDINPPLPRRPASQSAPQPAVFDGTDESLMMPVATGQLPQPAVFDGATGIAPVQQYYDPATGMIYVDQQQYQQQFLLQQQQQQQHQLQQLHQQQLQQQQTQAEKNELLSLYQRPDLYTTPVEINQNNPNYQLLSQVQQQQQQELLQMQHAQMQSAQPPQQMYQAYYMP